MEVCGNLSNSSVIDHHVQLRPDLTAFLFVYAIACVPVAIFIGLTAVLLLQSSSVAITVRVPLLNLLVITLITNVVFVCTSIGSAASALSHASPPLPLCRFVAWFYSVSMVARLLGQMIFSALMFHTATCGNRKIQAKCLMMCSLVASWVIALVSRAHFLVPGIYGYQYVGGIVCFATAGCPEYEALRLITTLLWLVLTCCLPLLMCICISLATLCYIKCHTISEGAQYNKAMVKLAAFLITENALNVLGVIVQTVIVRGSLATINTSAVVYLTYTTILLSYFPTPVLIIVFLKPVRKRLRHLFCSKCQKDNTTLPMQQSHRLE